MVAVTLCMTRVEYIEAGSRLAEQRGTLVDRVRIVSRPNAVEASNTNW